MLSIFDRRPGYSRREFLRIGALGLGGLSLPLLLGARALAAGDKPITTGKSVIFLHMFGGPSQFETFDPKMSAPDGIRSVTGEISTALPGVTFGSLFPQLAKRADRLAVMRSYVPGREISNHVLYPIVHPRETLGACLGSLYSHTAGMTNPANGLPTNATVFPQSVNASCKPIESGFGNFLATGPLSPAFAPGRPRRPAAPFQQDMRLNVDRDCLDDRRRLLAQFDDLRCAARQVGRPLASMERIQSQAFYDVILRNAADAFDLSQESPGPSPATAAGLAPPIKKTPSSSNYLDHGKTLGKQLLPLPGGYSAKTAAAS